jgi:hypothetical protein
MPFVRAILTLNVTDETDAANQVAALEAQFPDQAIVAQYTNDLTDDSAVMTVAKANLKSGSTAAPAVR